MFFSGFSLPELLTYAVLLVVSLSVHESAHALVAYLLGDSTAKYQGRISLNPMRHLDPMGALFLVFVGFGWGRPVPVDTRNFTHPEFYNALVALAGPVSNLLFGAVFAVVAGFSSGFMREAMELGIMLNAMLAVFNLLPIPPLDGGSLVRPLLPYPAAVAFDQYGPFALFAVIAADMVFGTHILGGVVGTLANIVAAFLKVLS